MSPIACAGVVLQNKERKYALVLGRDANKWSFPKGHLDCEENFKNCAIREVYEEIGLRISIPNGKTPCFKSGNELYYFVYTKGTPILRPRDHNEIIRAGWFSMEEMRKLPWEQLNHGIRSFLLHNR